MKLSDKVIAAIKKDIASGRLKKGEKIPAEPELMEIYQVGRSTIREAIKTLAISGILKVQQGSGTFVASKIRDESLTQRLRRADFEEVNTVRAVLENEIVRLACTNRTAADIENMQELLLQRKKAIEASQPKKCMDADVGFHISIAKAAGNKVLSDLYENFSLVLQDFFEKREENIGHFSRSQQSHEDLAAAIAKQDQKSAEQLLKSILHHNY
ncbi:DNA-binding transcriptional regulator, FadR family [Pedobacter westerhofensis]|uniref:DNA-binding transcriptional regulator, FadR family n=1 Tax=Pedobacter westerhofensis TaxID=425512 RepID=A0A521EX05_9SPHI|nr:FadR/GntR family transcriptional regulator [Pedobacter westerhofensis]SMO87951.1 DNA-binding transcriptional regulator, FadR family [Pedobacter westerhofensis]